MTSVLDLSKCLPSRTQDSWEIVEQRKRIDHRKTKENNKKVLPMSILVKIRGPPKLVDSYKIAAASPGIGERSVDTSASCTPLNLAPFEKRVDSKRKGAVILKPALQQSKQVPGRYFPKPTLTDEQQRALLSSKDSHTLDLDRYRTETSISNTSSRQSRTLGRATTDLNRPLKRNFTNSSFNPKTTQMRKTLFEASDDKPNLFTITFRGGNQDEQETRDDLYSDFYLVKRIGSMSRHVSFPHKTNDFRDTLKGVPKVLHYRKDVQSAPCGEKADEEHGQLPSTAS